MSNTNELGKLLSATGSVVFAGAGIASLFTGGFAPLLWGSASFVLAGASGLNLLAMDNAGLLKEEKEEALKELASAKEKLRIVESELRSELNRMTTERNNYKRKLEAEVADFKVRCQELKDGIEYWETGMHPAILELPPVKKLVGTLKSKLLETSEKLEATLIEIIALKEENKSLKQKVAELEVANDEIDSELAARLLELAQLKTNFDYKLRDELHKSLQPYCSQAVTTALEKKLAEIDKLKQAIAMLQEDIGNYQQVMDGLEKETLPEIEKTYKMEMSEADSKLMQLAGQNELLQQKITELEAPRLFPGLTTVDEAGNRVIQHFAQFGIVLDALEAVLIPGGYLLRFRCDRSPDKTKISAEEFNKVSSQVGLMGLSAQPLEFAIDPLNLVVQVKIFLDVASESRYSSDSHATSKFTATRLTSDSYRTSVGHRADSKKGDRAPETSDIAGKSRVSCEEVSKCKYREEFVKLGCFPKDQFEELIKLKLKDKARIIAGSAGGKSPLVEMYCLAVAKRYAQTRKNGAVVYFPNPIPAGDKDYFVTPSIVKSGEGGVEKVAEYLDELLVEVLHRCSTGAESDEWPFIMLMLDEGNMIARYHDRQGELIKQILQAGSHAYVGLGCSGQGLEISGWSGRSKKPANMLRANDFLVGASHILIDEAILLWLDKHFSGQQRDELRNQYYQLVELCQELNRLEDRIASPITGAERKVDVNAYRFAFATVPAGKPFFFQIPDYGSISINGLSFPEGAEVTSRYHKQPTEIGDRILNSSVACPHCGSTIFFRKKPYADGSERFECGNRLTCRKTFRLPAGK